MSEQRRDASTVGVTADTVHRWCEKSTMPGRHPELSDPAAVAIATGHLDAAARGVMLTRMSRGLPIPLASQLLPGAREFAELRRLQRSVAALDEQANAPVTPAVVAAVIRARRNSVARRLDDARRALVGGKGVFATGVRAIRRERREGTHLEAVDRERLFIGLSYTPTPDLGGYVRRMGNAALERVAGVIENAAAKAGKDSGRRWLPDLVAEAELTPGADSRFVDGYETMLFAAGSFYDRVRRCPAWHSEHFTLQRGQVDLEAELAEIAADVIALRAIRVDLGSARRAAGFDDDLDGHIVRREESLRPVWRELVDRVSALATVAEVVESAAAELRVLEEYAHTATIDDRIDDLVARSGSREVSADNTRRLTEQVRAGEENLRIYRDVLQGNILRLSAGSRPWSGE